MINMQVYSDISKELAGINFEIERTILMPFTESAIEYENKISSLVERVKVLSRKEILILNELDLIFFEDEAKYNRGLNLWFYAINDAFEKVCYNFEDENLTSDLIASQRRFFASYMQVVSKIYHSDGKIKVKLNECGLFYAYTLDSIKKKIEERREQLQHPKTGGSNEVIKTNEQLQRSQLDTININENPDNWKPLIKEELYHRLSEIEAKLVDKIPKWRQGDDKIGCAAFCQLLFEKKYFVDGSTSVKSVNEFSLRKYSNPIMNQLNTTNKEWRETHKKLLKKYFS